MIQRYALSNPGTVFDIAGAGKLVVLNTHIKSSTTMTQPLLYLTVDGGTEQFLGWGTGNINAIGMELSFKTGMKLRYEDGANRTEVIAYVDLK